jgi:hypothetical protein
MPLPTAFATVLLLVELATIVISLIASVKIITKAGYSGWYILLSFVPLVNMAAFVVFAFSKWPVEQRLETALRQQRQPMGPDGPYGWGGPRGGGPGFGGPPGPVAPSSWDYVNQH